MGLEMELSEFAVIRPIRTAGSRAGSATPMQPGSEEGKDAADTGCVTQTAVSPSPLHGIVDAGCVTPTAARPSPLQGGFDVDNGCVTTTALSPSPRQGGVDADDTGCVTPARAMSSVTLQVDVADDSNTGCVTPTAATSPVPRRRVFVVDLAIGCVTPTSAASVLRPSTECPPAPRKPERPPPANKRKPCDGRAALRRCFFPVPRDLTKVFVPRGPADSSPPQAAKKVRVHPVG